MIKIIGADDQHRIYLPGVGEVARPVDLDQGSTGLARLKSLRIYRFLPGQVVDGDAEEDEVCIVFMTGNVGFEVVGTEHRWDIRGRASVFGGAPHVVYLSPHHHYRLTPHTEAEVAYARASAQGEFPPHLFQPDHMPERRGGGMVLRTLLPPTGAEQLRCDESLFDGERTWEFNDTSGEHFRHCQLEDAHETARLLASSEPPRRVGHRDTIVSTGNAFALTHASKLYVLHVSVTKRP